MLEFQLENGEKIKSQSNIHSGGIPTIGEKIRIIYKKGSESVDEISVRSLGMYGGLLIMLFFMGLH